MGKTRLVSDFAKQHHLKLVYACYRKPGSTGFPLSVGNFYNCLMDILDSEGVQNGRLNPIHVCSSVLLQVIHMLLMEDTGQYDYQHGISENSYSYERLWQTAFNNARKCAFSSEPASLDFLNTAPQTDSNDPFRLFLVFDEASWMLQCDVWIKPCRWNQTKPLVKVDLFQVLRCSLHVIADHLVKFGVLPIFIDSDPAISKNFPLVTGDEIDEETFPRQIFPPYFHINVAPTTFCHIDWFLFGRPLWGAMHSQRKHPYETPEHETINFACQKWNYRFQSLDIWSTAVMCCLLDLEINVETQMKEEMIRSLMV
jgi:hypothetical protein